MIKKFLKIFIIISIVILMAYSNKFESSATKTWQKHASNFIQNGASAASSAKINTAALTSPFVDLGQILTSIGAGVLVAAVAYMGIMYMISPPDKQAALKKQSIGLVVAGIVVFGSYGIWKMVVGILDSAIK